MKMFKKVAAVAVFGALVFVAAAAFADEPQFNVEREMQNPSVESAGEAEETKSPHEDGRNRHEAAENNEDKDDETREETREETYSSQTEAEQVEETTVVSNFLSLSGVVKEISPVFGSEGEPIYNQYYVKIQSAEHGTHVFRTDYHTFILGEPIAVGDTITGWYASGTPSMLIYPPQHLGQVLVNGEYENVKIDRFYLDRERSALVSENSDLVLNFTDRTPVLLQDGNEYKVPEGSALLNELDGRILVVTYSMTDRMIPSGTLPSDTTLSITVLWEKAEHLPEKIDNTEPQSSSEAQGAIGYLGPQWTSNDGISVNNKKLDITWKYVENTVYVPFRAIVNALGYGDTVVWDGYNKMITANNGKSLIAFPINANHFIVGEQLATLEHPAILEDGTTYVPWQFFRDVFGANAWFSSGQVYVNTEYAVQ